MMTWDAVDGSWPKDELRCAFLLQLSLLFAKQPEGWVEKVEFFNSMGELPALRVIGFAQFRAMGIEKSEELIRRNLESLPEELRGDAYEFIVWYGDLVRCARERMCQ